MPIWRRKWFLDRVVAEIKASNQSKGQSSSERGLSSKMRPTGPQRTKRFT